MLIINGAPIRFRTRTRIELTTHARFVFGKQVMLPEAAETASRQLYLALQTAYVGTVEEREPALATARTLAAALKESSGSAFTRDTLDRALAAALVDDGFTALRFARLLVQQEDSDRARCPTFVSAPGPMPDFGLFGTAIAGAPPGCRPA